ncbi:preprotein translocase subunit SecE [Algiphilus sp. W345]|uniref:Protein translocase subunit SecE n=1 Tax=Banduia mediterranea TaxID=3075609 RepID=A0ABU2WF16_9GAMM|nr:preprotein translocase subunit SecE [Algiphilus sp. W345]MDT0496459.1 preprotein translocase subunit SecE [Algiphilus sp. W345]
MNQTSQTPSDTSHGSRLDTLWLVGALLVVVGAIFVFYRYQSDLNAAIRAVVMIAGIGIGAFLVYQARIGKTTWDYVRGARVELRKTVWPTKQEAVQTTLMIAVVVLIMAVFLWGLDAALLKGVKLLTGRAS